MVMAQWRSTHSPVAYWFNKFHDENFSVKKDREVMAELLVQAQERGRGPNLTHGLPTSQALELCKELFRKNVAKLTLQIRDPNVMKIVKSVRVTFADELSAIGKQGGRTIRLRIVQL